MDTDKMLEALEAHLNSDEGKAYFENERKKQEAQEARYAKLEVFLSTLTDEQFDGYMTKLIAEHTDELRDFWYNKSIMPMPTNKMLFLFDYVFQYAPTAIHYAVENEKLYDEYATGFSDDIAEYRGYVFHMFFGQGVAYGIHKNKEKIFWGW